MEVTCVTQACGITVILSLRFLPLLYCHVPPTDNPRKAIHRPQQVRRDGTIVERSLPLYVHSLSICANSPPDRRTNNTHACVAVVCLVYPIASRVGREN